jgi:hypothetical protein
MKSFKYQPPTIWDLRLRLLKYEVDDTKLSDLLDDLTCSIRRSEIACEKADETNPEIADAISENETAYIEELIGISLVALQTKICRFRETAKDFSINPMNIGDEFSGTGRTLIGPIWHIANYYKHRDEWSDEVWDDTTTTERGIEQARRTRRIVQQVGIEKSSTGNLRTAFEFFGVYPYSNCGQLAKKVQEWAEAVYAECAKEAADKSA